MSTADSQQGAPEAEIRTLLERLLKQFADNLPPADEELLRGLAAWTVTDPAALTRIHEQFYRRHLELWSSILSGAPSPQPELEPAAGDHRFDADEWRTLPWFAYLKHAYLLNSQWLTAVLDAAPLAAQDKSRAAFVLRAYLDAMAPTNFPSSNPDALRAAAASRGASLDRGLEHLREDLARGRIKMTDEAAFEVGRNLAITPGAVVYQNEVMQLIEYAPRGAKVFERPLLVVPPFINKFYILDLQPENSFVRYALERGFQVFMVSWRNVPPELGGLTWEDYIRRAVFDALDVVLEISAAATANVLGFCVGGTLLASALAVIDRPERIASLTLLATMLDFSDVGEIGVYVDEAYVQRCETMFRAGGVLAGRQLASTFASLRANELIWYFVINNYLLGRTPRPFDLLYWNSDDTNLPGALYAWYLRNTYLENRLRVADKVELCGKHVDFASLTLPSFVLAAREDHIVPWRSAYTSAQLLGGECNFVLAASGHIAGVINAPAAQRRHHWIGSAPTTSADAWLAQAQSVPGSWWPRWADWLQTHAGAPIEPRAALGSERHPPLEAAPGSYVKQISS